MNNDADRSEHWSRRKFLAVSAAMAATAAYGNAGVAATTETMRKKVLHIIGHSHIDAAWLWPWRDGADLALSTFRSALDRMNETPEFRYSHSSAAHYRWAQRADPKMFEEVRRRVREGRWEVVGGWPVEPDCNIPSSESFVRDSLYGKAYIEDALGVDVKVGFNPDAFGHAAGIPTLLAGAGYRYYVFLRPQEKEMDLPLLFWWEGPDGSRLLTLRIYRSYDNPASRIAEAVQHSFATGFNDAAFFLGVGDHGGAVTKQEIKDVLAMWDDVSLPEFKWSTLGEFFAAVERSPGMASLPVIKGELQHHSRGCYSANGPGKYQNRRAERSLGIAETIALAAKVSADHAYPAEDYARAWWKVLFNQFHDLMAGTSLYSDYEDNRDGLGFACETAMTSKVEALHVMAKRVDMRSVRESAVFLFNPLPWKRRALMEVYVKKTPKANPQITHLRSHEGEVEPVQFRPSRSMTSSYPRLTAWVDLPACGYKVFELAYGDAPKPRKYLENISISSGAFGISSIRAADGTEMLAGPMGLVVIKDTSDTWGHGMDQFREELGRPTFVSSTLMEDGPVVRVTRQRARWEDSEIVLDISRFAGSDVVELHFVIDWRQRQQMLKLELPTKLGKPTVYAKVPGAVVQRRPTGGEEPYQDWLAVQGNVGPNEYALGLMNNCTYSYDCLNGLLRTVLIRSAPFASHGGKIPANDDNAWQDQGRQERRFWIVVGRGDYSALAMDRRADEVQSVAEYVMDSAHEGTEAWEKSLLEISPSTVAVLAVKRAETGDNAMIVR
ncbi:MAG TPA: glycoside hydrolase family 38 C-terminal domain-containing protein, partial [Tepidisphaeraceae bacterium]|nr:glycoside hydrolase family 38 C-terminal domain-containing protein [Tepidisphaeraceae bacterium]